MNKLIDELMAEKYDFARNPKHYKLKLNKSRGHPLNEDQVPKTIIIENRSYIIKRGRQYSSGGHNEDNW